MVDMIAKVSWVYNPNEKTFTVVKIDGQGIEGENLENNFILPGTTVSRKEFFSEEKYWKTFWTIIVESNRSVINI
jgi:hypothetical protein